MNSTRTPTPASPLTRAVARVRAAAVAADDMIDFWRTIPLGEYVTQMRVYHAAEGRPHTRRDLIADTLHYLFLGTFADWLLRQPYLRRSLPPLDKPF